MAVNGWRVPRRRAVSAGAIAIETRERDGPTTPGPRVPAPQPHNKVRHTMTMKAQHGFTGAADLIALVI